MRNLNRSPLPESGANQTTRNSARILMLDDEESLRTLFSRICRKRGHVLTGVETLEEALQALSEQEFDLMLMDMNLIWLTGIQALEQIRAAGYQLPAIIFSCAVELEDLNSMKHLGVIGIMDKSHNNEALFELIDKQLEAKSSA